MHSENKLPLVPIRPLVIKRMVIIGEGQELHQAKLSLTMKSTIIKIEIRAHLVKAWETTP